jgi:V8-like Glu-specific endopeptidase
MASKEDNKIVGSGPGSTGRKQDAAAVAEYWTPERMAAAIPVPMPKEPKGNAPAAETIKPNGQPGKEEPGHPNGSKAESRAQEAEKFQPRTNGGSAVANPLAYPFTTCGKLFFTQGGKDYSGSASVVAPNVLLTAGHCVYLGGWSSNVAFYPSYPKRGATDPNYRFSYSYEAAWTAWSQHSNRAYDYGFIWIDNDPGHKVGWLGMMWNAATSGRTWEAVGYPATPNPPFNGNVMDEAVGKVASSSTSGTIGLTNDNMEHGSSGGPWITDFNGSPREYANGLQSFHITDGDFTEYGPYFTADLKGLFDWISNPANRH